MSKIGISFELGIKAFNNVSYNFNGMADLENNDLFLKNKRLE